MFFLLVLLCIHDLHVLVQGDGDSVGGGCNIRPYNSDTVQRKKKAQELSLPGESAAKHFFDYFSTNQAKSEKVSNTFSTCCHGKGQQIYLILIPRRDLYSLALE